MPQSADKGRFNGNSTYNLKFDYNSFGNMTCSKMNPQADLLSKVCGFWV